MYFHDFAYITKPIFVSEEAPQDNPKALEESEITNLIDTILREDDKDSDGYIDYAEYILSTKK